LKSGPPEFVLVLLLVLETNQRKKPTLLLPEPFERACRVNTFPILRQLVRPRTRRRTRTIE
jgi:hypothetical protein